MSLKLRQPFWIIAFAIFVGSSVTQAQSVPCSKSLFQEPNPYLVARASCHATGALASFEYWFQGERVLSSRWLFDPQERLLSFESFNLEGVKTQAVHYRHLEKDLYETQSEKAGAPGKVVVSRLQIHLRPSFRETLVQKTYLEEGRKVLIEKFENDLITELEVFDAKGNFETRYQVRTENGPRSTLWIQSFKMFDSKGRPVGEFDHEAPVVQNPRGHGLRPVVIMDSGIDFFHPKLKDKMAHVSGLGVFPETMSMGWYFDPFSGKNSPQILDQIYYSLGRYPYVPFSHGTHVAALAIEGVSQFGLVGFSGDYSEPEFLDRISAWLQKSGTRFVNMSFGFGDLENPFGAGSASRTALVRMMAQNPQVLFVVAAGNDGADLDSEKKDDVPPKAPVENKIVVAALKTDQIQREQMEHYELAPFSNFGSRTVDLAAAGDDVLSANVGGGSLRVSGTSMAAPQVLNAALKISEVNPALTALEIKEILNCTAYRPKSRALPLVSGGILDLEAALQAARASREGARFCP